MKFLSIDFSTQNTGYTFQDNDGNYVVGQIPVSISKVRSPYERTQLIIEALSDMIIEYQLMDRLIAIEEPIIVFKNSMSLIRSNGMVLGAMRQKFNMGFIDVPNVKWASYHLIKGNNKKGKLAKDSRKQQSIDVLRKANLLPEEALQHKDADDMADAYCIYQYVINTYKKG